MHRGDDHRTRLRVHRSHVAELAGVLLQALDRYGHALPEKWREWPCHGRGGGLPCLRRSASLVVAAHLREGVEGQCNVVEGGKA
jgi:hypothetical protein